MSFVSVQNRFEIQNAAKSHKERGSFCPYHGQKVPNVDL
jgi:hypothetical protein